MLDIEPTKERLKSFILSASAGQYYNPMASFVEKTICSDPLLGKLDDALAQNYKSMLESDFGESKKSLKQEQLKWLANRNQCTTKACLIEMYRQRVDETCDYGVISGVHPECINSEDIE